MDSPVYPNKDFVAASKKWVSIYCNKESEHGSKKVGLDKELCAIIAGITCDEHTKNFAELSGKFFKGTIMNPTHIWCDPDGNEIGRQVGAMPTKGLVEKMGEALKKVGPGLGGDEYAYMNDKIAEGQKASEENKPKDAIAAWTAVTKMSKNPGAKNVVARAQAGLDKLNEYGKDQVAKAKDLATGGDVEGARKLLKEIYSGYKGLDCAKDAEKEIANLPKPK